MAGALSQIATAIKGLDHSPESEKQMLLAALPNTFSPNMHKFQKDFATMLRKSFETARAGAMKAHGTAKQKVSEAHTILETGQADVEASKAAEEGAHTLLNEKLAVLAKAQIAIKEEEARLQEAESRKALVATQRTELEAARAEVESVKNGSFQMLREGGWEDQEVCDTCIDAVCDFLKNDGCDAVLLAALPKALRRRPDECGAFDKIAVEEAFRVISDKLEALTAKLAQGEHEFEDLFAEHLGAWAILDVAREREQTANEVCDSARTALGAAAAEAKFAVSKVMDQQASLATVLADATLIESKVQQYDVALSAMTQLEVGEVGKEIADDVMKVDKETAVACGA